MIDPRTTAIALLVVLLSPQGAQADECGDPETDVAGVWRLVEASTTQPDGHVEHPYGQPPSGLFVYTPGGHLSLHLHGNPPPSFDAPPDDAAIAGLARQYIGYFGRWSISDDGESVVHHIEGALNPNRIGRDAERPYRLCGDVLELRIGTPSGREYYRRLERLERFAEKPASKHADGALQ